MIRFYFHPTPNPAKVALFLEESGLEYELVPVDTSKGEQHSPEFRAINPNGKVPAIIDTEGPGGKEVRVFDSSAILLYLGPKLGLAGIGESDGLWTHQLQLTIADAVAEAHDTHHPISTGDYYEDQRDAAVQRARAFREARIPKFLNWFEQVLQRNPSGDRHLVGDVLTYADLSLFQLVDGLQYAFPKAAARALADTPAVVKLHANVRRRQRVHDYLQSPRRIAFNEDGIFRRYAELDG